MVFAIVFATRMFIAAQGKAIRKMFVSMSLFFFFIIAAFVSIPVMSAMGYFPHKPPETYSIKGIVSVDEGTMVILQGEHEHHLWGLVYKTLPAFKPDAKFTDEEFSKMYEDKDLVKKNLIGTGR